VERGQPLPLRQRPAALVAVGAARLLARQPPRRLRVVLGLLCGHHLLYRSALALAAAGLAWARQTGAELAELTATVIR
jgi:hypothetical protein